jgi:hypothetical protein
LITTSIKTITINNSPLTLAGEGGVRVASQNIPLTSVLSPWGEEIRRCPFLNFRVSGLKFSLTSLFIYVGRCREEGPTIFVDESSHLCYKLSVHTVHVVRSERSDV